MASVTIGNLKKVYPGHNSAGEVTAVEDLSLQIQDRDFVVIVGPPGCGLSSIIRLIAGLDKVSSGEILIGNGRVNDVPPSDRDLSVVFQDYKPYPRLTVQENLEFGLKRRKFSDAETKKRINSAAEALGLSGVLSDNARSLSTEQRQRLAIARATALQPGVILFDEPLANLNRKAQMQFRDEIVKLHQRLRATVIYATHDPLEAMALGSRIVLFRSGVVQQDGTARTLYEEPENVFVAEFFGHPPMNIIRGEIKQDREGFLFSEAGDGTIKLRLSELAFGAVPAAGQVLLGVRPNEIRMPQSRPGSGKKNINDFAAIIEHLEAGDGATTLYLDTGGHKLVSRSDSPSVECEAGHRGDFELNPAKLRLFDPLSGIRLGLKI